MTVSTYNFAFATTPQMALQSHAATMGMQMAFAHSQLAVSAMAPFSFDSAAMFNPNAAELSTGSASLGMLPLFSHDLQNVVEAAAAVPGASSFSMTTLPGQPVETFSANASLQAGAGLLGRNQVSHMTSLSFPFIGTTNPQAQNFTSSAEQPDAGTTSIASMPQNAQMVDAPSSAIYETDHLDPSVTDTTSDIGFDELLFESDGSTGQEERISRGEAVESKVETVGVSTSSVSTASIPPFSDAEMRFADWPHALFDEPSTVVTAIGDTISTEATQATLGIASGAETLVFPNSFAEITGVSVGETAREAHTIGFDASVEAVLPTDRHGVTNQVVPVEYTSTAAKAHGVSRKAALWGRLQGLLPLEGALPAPEITDPFIDVPIRFPSRDYGHVAYRVSLAGSPVLRHYVRDASGKPVFAGWERAEAGAHVLPTSNSHSRWSDIAVTVNTNRVLSLGMPGGETAYRQDPAADKGVIVGDKFVSLIFSQLSMGPESLDDESVLNALNVFLSREIPFDLTTPISSKEWKSFIAEAIRLSVRHAPAFDDGGARTAEAIRDDAAKLLRMDAELFASWENYFGHDSISMHMLGTVDAPEFSGMRQVLLDGMDIHFAAMAEMELDIPGDEAGFAKDEETEVQWDVALFSSLDADQKVEAVSEYMTELMKARRNAVASRALAVIFKHSVFNDLPSEADGIVARWSDADMAMLVRRIMTGDTWSIASHRSFRRYLSPEENGAINKLVAEANYQNSIAAVYDVDVMSSTDEDFWDAVDETGEADAIIDFVVSKMVAAAGH